MRPRPLGRGRRSITISQKSSPKMLQCGHGLLAVEDLTIWLIVSKVKSLQCGHGLLAVEDCAAASGGCANRTLQCGHGLLAVEDFTQPTPKRVSLLCFNAATASWPWKTVDVPSTEGVPATLQCGHGLLAVEDVLGAEWQDPAAYASMRPRPLGRGRRTAFWGCRRQSASASMRPRPLGRGRPDVVVASVATLKQLQCGHGLLAVEDLLAKFS